jgi:hypothetical protein
MARLFDEIRKDMTAADAHVATALGNQPGKRWRPFKAFVGTTSAPTVSKQAAEPALGGPTGRQLALLDGSVPGGVYHMPLTQDPAALSYVRPDQVPRFLAALTDPDLGVTRQDMPFDQLTAIKNRVGGDVVRHFMREPSDKPPTVVAMNGGHYLVDGHDRAVAHWLGGHDTMAVNVKDLEAVSNAMKRDGAQQRPGSLNKRSSKPLQAADDGLAENPFPYDPAGLGEIRPDQVPRLLRALTHPDDLQTRTLPFANLTALQDRVDPGKVEAIRQGEHKPQHDPVVVRFSDKNWIVDGDHHLVAQLLDGADSAKVRFVDISPKTEALKAWSTTLQVTKADPDQQLIFGWASVVTKGGQPVIDHQSDIIPVEELERAAYDYVLYARDHSDMHREMGCGRLVESLVFTTEKQAALGIDLGFEGWFVGFRIDDPGLWAAHKRGERPELSIGGTALPMPI